MNNFPLRIYFGSPGSGKTTLLVHDLLASVQKNGQCVHNVQSCKIGNFNDFSELGKFAFPFGTTVYFDEAGITYNNRKFKTLSQSVIRYAKLHRHFGNTINFYSQSWEDIDITFRRLADELWYVKRIGIFTLCRKVRKFVTIDETTHQIIDGYKFEPMIWSILPPPFHRSTARLILRRKRLYKQFDSFDIPDDIAVHW